jgi:hypothetical protein
MTHDIQWPLQILELDGTVRDCCMLGLMNETASEMADRLRRERRERAIELLTEKMAATDPAAELDAAALMSAMAGGRHALDALVELAARMVASGVLDIGEAADGIARLRGIDTGRLTQARQNALSRR